MDGIHDLGGMHGFGAVEPPRPEPVFHERWEGRAFALASLALGLGVANLDAFRHAIESVAPSDYLTRGYYWRWLDAAERLLVRAGVLTRKELNAQAEALATGMPRTIELSPAPVLAPASPLARVADTTAPRFAVGARVRCKDIHPAGHTRLPRYVRGHAGLVAAMYGEWVFPDTHAHGRGECPQHLYNVRFQAAELWGGEAEPGTTISVDLFESYLEPA